MAHPNISFEISLVKTNRQSCAAHVGEDQTPLPGVKEILHLFRGSLMTENKSGEEEEMKLEEGTQVPDTIRAYENKYHSVQVWSHLLNLLFCFKQQISVWYNLCQ